jgi:hypothetical protein
MKEKLRKILTPEDLQAIGDVVYGIVDKQVATLASKQDLKSMEIRLNTRIDEGIEAVVQGMDSLSEQMAEKKTVEELGEWAAQAGNKIGLKVKNRNL